jgi:uncharacterized surface protein with fasciclin (FAS1) repeats
MKTIKFFGLAALALAAIGLIGCYTSENQYHGRQVSTMNENLLQVCQDQSQFSTWTKLVKAAGLDQKLASEGPYTVFAPTDNAFSRLPAGSVDDLLKTENRDKLINIVDFHIVSGKLTTDDIVKQDTLTTVEGQVVPIRMLGTDIMIGNARVERTSIPATNGLIYPVDTVLMPNK